MSEENLSNKLKNMNMFDDRAPRQSFTDASVPSSSSQEDPNSAGTTIAKTSGIAKSDLPYQKQKIIERPGMVQNMKLGKKIKLLANFIAFKTNSNPIKLHQYDIEMIIKGKRETKRERTSAFFWKFFEQSRDIFPDIDQFVYNDVNILWSKVALRIDGEHHVELNGRMGPIGQLIIKFTGVVEFSENAKLSSDRDLVVSIIDAVISQRARCPDRNNGGSGQQFVCNKNAVYSKFFCTNDRSVNLTIPLGSALEAWTGLHFAAKMNLQMGPAANIDLSHSAYYIPNYSLIRFLIDIIHNRSVTEQEYEQLEESVANRGMSDHNRRQAEKVLKGKAVMATHLERPRQFKFSSLTSTPATHTFFFVEETGRDISVAEYYFNKRMKLRFPQLPCVVGPALRGKRGVQLFPMEFVSTINEPQKMKGQLHDAQIARMVRETAYNAPTRFEIIKTLALDGHRDGCDAVVRKDRWLESFDLDVGQDFVTVDATVLPPPTLIYGNSTYYDEYHHGVWTTVEGDSFRTVLSNRCEEEDRVKLIVPSIITIQNPLQSEQESLPYDLKHFYILMETVSKFGQPIYRSEGDKGIPAAYYIGSHHQNWGVKSLYEKLLNIKNHMANDEKLQNSGYKIVPLILFVFANRSTTINTKRCMIASDYAIIKQLCDGELGMNCQGILLRTFMSIGSTPSKCSTAHNMAYKILAKIGTTFYKLEKDGRHKNWSKFTDSDEPTLILGIDVTHPGDLALAQGGISALSVAAVVGNVDIEISKFGESVRIQQCGQEQIIRLEEAIAERVSAFTKHSGKRPAHIVVYRDGVSESEFKRTLYEEKLTIKQACSNLDSSYNPTLTYIVVTKRHHTRFLAKNAKESEGRAFNVKPGTLVENTICSKTYFDFYLVSHFGALGTSRPSHYYVLWDEWAPSNAFWQTITYALCYSYTIAPRSISIPSVVQYAHLCAKRAKDRLMGIEEIKRDRNETFNLNEFEHYANVVQQIKPHVNLKGMLYC